MNVSLPKSIQSLSGYSPSKFFLDLIAGVTVGLVALPLAMAFAIASGLPPQSGLYCAVIAGFLTSALGGSRFQIGGPTGAFVVVVSGIVAKYGIEGLFMCTMMAGVILVILGVTGMGTAVKFIPRSIVVGFTNGIALLIASTQIKDFFGLQLASVPGDFLGRMSAIVNGFHTVSLLTSAVAGGSLALIIFCMRFVKKVPGSIVAMLAGTLIVLVLGLPVDTIGSRFGEIPSGLPPFRIPPFRPELILILLSPAVTVAMLGAIESLMSAVVADRMGGDTHQPNTELVAQGIANIASPLFSGLPATGAIARTATNIRSGARTPVAGMIHALTVLAVLLFAAPLAKFIPMSVLAAILMIVSYNMGEWREIPEILKLSKSDISVWLVTFALTVFADLTVAVEVGMVLASLLFIRKIADTTTVTRITPEDIESGRMHILQDKKIPTYVAAFRIHGPFLFGTTDKVNEIARTIAELPPVVILRLRNMTALDGTGLQALEELADKLHASGRTLILCGAREQPARLILQAEFRHHVGRENICRNIKEALHRAEQVHTKVPVS